MNSEHNTNPDMNELDSWLDAWKKQSIEVMGAHRDGLKKRFDLFVNRTIEDWDSKSINLRFESSKKSSKALPVAKSVDG